MRNPGRLTSYRRAIFSTLLRDEYGTNDIIIGVSYMYVARDSSFVLVANTRWLTG